MNDWELEDETSYLPPPPKAPEPHEFDLLPPEVRDIFYDIIKYRVDPAGDYYGMSLAALTEKIRTLDTTAVHAIESEYRYERKASCPIL